MALVTSVRSTPPVRVGRGYGKPCGTPYTTLYGYYTPSYEKVVSYRGKPEYIQVANKRRKKFHPFTRYKLRLKAAPSYWCGGGTNTCWHQSWPLYCSSEATRAYPNVSGMPENTTFEGVTRTGESYRDFVVRDIIIKANEPRYNSAVFLAELGETLVGVHKLLAGSVKVLLKSNEAWKAVKHFSLNSEELWLWYRYALMPAILDANSLLAAIKPQVKIDRVQDGNRVETSISGTFGDIYWPGTTKQFSATSKWSTELKVGCGGAMDIHSRFDPSEWGTGLNDIIAAGWEGIPFSFLFDWFINVGDWIASLRKIEIDAAQTYATYAINAKTIFSPGSVQYPSGFPEIEIFLQTRIVDLELPILPLVDKEWANITRTVDLITLTVGMLKGILAKGRR